MHNFFLKKHSWYRAYHESKYSNVLTWAAFLGIATFYTTSCIQSIYYSYGGGYDQVASVFEGRQTRDIAISLTANPAQVKPGEMTRVSWTAKGAQRCRTSNGLSGLSGSFLTPTLTENIAYEVTCFTLRSRVSSRIEINVEPSSDGVAPIDFTGPLSGRVGVATEPFLLEASSVLVAPITVTPVSSGGGTFSPASLVLSSESPVATFTYTPDSVGTKIISVQSSDGLISVGNRNIEVTPSPLESKMDLFWSGNLRGLAITAIPANGVSTYTDKDFTDLVATGANVVRVPVHLDKNSAGNGYQIPADDILYVKQVLNYGSKLGFKVVVVLVPLPSGSGTDFWNNPSLEADIISKWEYIAHELKSYPALIAYDLINEPIIPGAERVSALRQWGDYALKMGRALQAVDPDTPIMFEPVPWGLPSAFWQAPLLDLPGVVYSFHLYAPHEFTHQELPNYPGGVVYPSGNWNKNYLYAEMLEARKIAAARNVPMFIGEFSCVRWAPEESCPRWLKDAVDLLAAENWGWTYHTWRGYHGWDAEIPTTVSQAQAGSLLPQFRSSTSTSIMLLKEAMSRN